MASKILSRRLLRAAQAYVKCCGGNQFLVHSSVVNSNDASRRLVTATDPHLSKDLVEVVFKKKDGSTIKAKGKVGDSLLDVVVNNNLDFDGFGACEGTLTCSTCHVILSKADYDRIPEKPTDEEFDMLDLAYDLCDTSRLGCQIELTKELNGIQVEVPDTVNDARS